MWICQIIIIFIIAKKHLLAFLAHARNQRLPVLKGQCGERILHKCAILIRPIFRCVCYYDALGATAWAFRFDYFSFLIHMIKFHLIFNKDEENKQHMQIRWAIIFPK